MTIALDTGERVLTHPAHPAAGDAQPAVSPDGLLVFRRNANALFSGELYRVRLGKDWGAVGEPQRLTAVDLDAEHPAFLPGGGEIVFSARGRLWRLDAASRAPDESAPRAAALRGSGRRDADALPLFIGTRGPAVVASGVGGIDLPLAASRDGRTILYGRIDASVVDLMLVEGFR